MTRIPRFGAKQRTALRLLCEYERAHFSWNTVIEEGNLFIANATCKSLVKAGVAKYVGDPQDRIIEVTPEGRDENERLRTSTRVGWKHYRR